MARAQWWQSWRAFGVQLICIFAAITLASRFILGESWSAAVSRGATWFVGWLIIFGAMRCWSIRRRRQQRSSTAR